MSYTDKKSGRGYREISSPFWYAVLSLRRELNVVLSVLDLLCGLKHPYAVGTVAECDIIDHKSAALGCGVTGDADAVNTVGLSSKSLGAGSKVLAVCVVVESDGVILCVELYASLNVYPTGELVGGINLYGSDNYAVPTDDIYNSLAVNVLGSADGKECLGDAPLGGPSGRVGAGVYKVEAVAFISVSVDLKRDKSERVAGRGCAGGAGVEGGNPKLKLTSVAGIVNKLVCTLVEYRLVGTGNGGVVGIIAYADDVVKVRAVEVVAGGGSE